MPAMPLSVPPSSLSLSETYESCSSSSYSSDDDDNSSTDDSSYLLPRPSKREYLLAQIRQKDAIIESLLKQVRHPRKLKPKVND